MPIIKVDQLETIHHFVLLAFPCLLVRFNKNKLNNQMKRILRNSMRILVNCILRTIIHIDQCFKSSNWNNENVKIGSCCLFTYFKKCSSHPASSQYMLLHFLQPYTCIEHHFSTMCHIS
jgi:hypothetical protein